MDRYGCFILAMVLMLLALVALTGWGMIEFMGELGRAIDAVMP